MADEFRILAPAKLNLFLRVVGRRPDGFHELETVFQAIDLADALTFAPAEDLRLTGGSEAAPPGPENLVLRAAAALREAAGTTAGAAIHLEKRVPVGAGLGGGSSDAAATLLALIRLWELRLPQEQLRGAGGRPWLRRAVRPAWRHRARPRSRRVAGGAADRPGTGSRWCGPRFPSRRRGPTRCSVPPRPARRHSPPSWQRWPRAILPGWHCC